ncbi:MAG TPA: hypothetical protein VGA56_11440 [Opitutaceae bacterium]
MSTTQLRKFADTLTARQRTYLRAYLGVLDRVQSDDYRKEMGRRMRAMKAGNHLTVSEVKGLLRKLDQAGR